MVENINIMETVQDALNTAREKIGVANILLAGRTGAGKSTLVNSVFQGNFTTTGQGKPVTSHTRKITKAGIPLSIYDTKGLEVKDYNEILKELLSLVERQNGLGEPSEHIHMCWLCIPEGSRRVEQAEIELAQQISRKMPVVVVITKAQADNGFKSICEDLLPSATNFIRVNSIPTILDSGFTIPVSGLDDLVIHSMEVIPEGQKKAFAAAQIIKLEIKSNSARKFVYSSAATAATAAATPIPFSDFLAIVPIQIGMLASVSMAFGLNIDKAFLGVLISGTLTSVSGSVGGRAAAGSLMKLIPGVGSIVGGAISATVASTITVIFGEAYIATLAALLKRNPDKQPTAEEITEAFKDRLKKTKADDIKTL